MSTGSHGHVREFDAEGLQQMLAAAGLEPLVFIPTQPHFFVYHTWIFGSRMTIEPATGRLLTTGVRRRIGTWLLKGSKGFFRLTGLAFWGRLLPRNYFIVARRG